MPGKSSRIEDTGRSTAFFPVVGLVIGLILVGLNWFFRFFLPPALTSALLVAAGAVLSGGLHLDGFIDTCDGVFVRRTPEERLRIMDDSHVGAFGVIGGVLVLLVRYAALSNLSADIIPVALILMSLTGRFLMVWAVFAYPYARPEGLGKIFKQQTTLLRLILAMLITLVAAFGFARFTGLVIIGISWVIINIVTLYFRSRLGGLTGDTYGAVNEIAEVSVLILFNIMSTTGWFIG